MENQSNKFEILIEHAKSILNFSFEELKLEYICYPICLIVHVENRILEKGIEVRFDKQGATFSCTFNQANRCNSIYLFLDNQKSENDFIEYLNKSYTFDFRKNCWQLDNCRLKMMKTKDFFYFYFF